MAVTGFSRVAYKLGGQTQYKYKPIYSVPGQVSGVSAGGVAGGGIDPAVSGAMERAIAFYGPEGGYGKGVEAALERGRVKAVAGGMQGLVSAGLAGTTMMGGLGKRFEEEVAMPARARVEETRAERVSGLEMLKAQIIQGATESARSRALQEYLAKLQASTSMALGTMRTTPSIRPVTPITPTKAEEPRQHIGSVRIPEFPGIDMGDTVLDPTAGQEIFTPGGGGATYIGAGSSLAGMAQRWLGETPGPETAWR